MPPRYFLRIALLPLLLSSAIAATPQSIDRIAFGSCARQDLPAPIWTAVVAAQPDVWIWLGDNVYADSGDPAILSAAYAKIKGHPEYSRLRAQSRILGIWDDHDYGKNDGGKEWTGKGAAQTALLDFLDEPADSPRRRQEGIYWSRDFGAGNEKIRVMLLDNRSFRDSRAEPEGDIFGPAQRAWIQDQLRVNDAALTLIATGTQALPEEHRYEKWADFPKARQWFLDQIKSAGLRNVIFLSGDRHIAEISRVQLEGHPFPLHEVTSSSLTHSWATFPGEPNRHRVGEVVTRNNFGLIEIDWAQKSLTVSIRDERGDIALEQKIGL